MFFMKRYGKLQDAELVALVAEGDDKAFREILARHQRAVHAFAYRFLGDADEAADIAQETFLRLYRTANTFTATATLKTFVLHIAKNLCIDSSRKKKPVLMDELPELVTDDASLETVASQQSMVALETAVRALPENQCTAVLLRHGQELRYDEIAEAMNVSVSAVESLLVRARKTLRQQLGPILRE